MLDWSLLPKDLLERINGRLTTCFEIVHFRSVCSSWRSAVPPPSHSHVNSLVPIFNQNPRFEGDKHCTLKKIPVFLLKFQTPFGVDYILLGTSESKSGKQKLLSPLQNRSFASQHGLVLNTYHSQIIPLGFYYKIKFYATVQRRYRPERRESMSKRAAFLPMDGKDFAVIAGVLGDLMMYRSCDSKWTVINRLLSYQDMVSYKGKFYVIDRNTQGHFFAIDPSFEITEIHLTTQSNEFPEERLVVSGDELLLVQRFTPGSYGQEYKYTWFRLFRLEEEGQRKWVEINDLEDRVVFLGWDWALCYSAKELPGMKGNCVVFVYTSPGYSGVLLYDLGTRKISEAFAECGSYMGAFCKNRESFMACGVVTSPKPGNRGCGSSSLVL